MTEQSKSDLLLAESISALVDNEASELELARILKSSDAAKVAHIWASYQVSSAAVRRDLPTDFAANMSLSFSERVSTAIESEAAHTASKVEKPLSGWWLGLSRMAVAASVAGAVVIGLQSFNQDTSTAGQGILANTQPTLDAPDISVPIGFNAPALTARTVSAEYGATPTRQVVFEPRKASVKVPNEQIKAYLDRLVGYHTDHAAINSAQGMLPYARLPLTPQAQTPE